MCLHMRRRLRPGPSSGSLGSSRGRSGVVFSTLRESGPVTYPCMRYEAVLFFYGFFFFGSGWVGQSTISFVTMVCVHLLSARFPICSILARSFTRSSFVERRTRFCPLHYDIWGGP